MSNQYGEAQLSFIKKVRGEIDKEKSAYFHNHQWDNICPSGGRFDSTLMNAGHKKRGKVESFYVKAMASWVPHLIFHNHVPCCPHCKKNDYVAVDKGRWINSPKILFCLQRHKYLDTWLYPCRGCGRTFAGYNKQSMQLDAAVYYGFFNYFVGRGYAVDEDLHKHIVLHAAMDSTASIAKKLDQMVHNAYFSDYQFYLSAVGFGKISVRPKKKSRRIDSYCYVIDKNVNGALGDAEELQRLINIRTSRSSALTQARLSHISAMGKCNTDLKFEHLLGDKDNHNVHGKGNVLPGLGSTKLRQLIQNRIYSAFDLLGLDPDDYADSRDKLLRWQELVLAYYDRHHQIERVAKLHLELAEADYEEALLDVIAFQTSLSLDGEQGITGAGAAKSTPEDEALNNRKASLFTAFKDKKGYNGRVISKHRIDCIVATVFQHRQHFQLMKMLGLNAQLLKIDFNYKIASKIRVWTRQGQSFAPYKCIVTVQNEDGQTVFWKALKHAESFTEIEGDLVRMRNRLNRNARAKLADEEAKRKEACAKRNETFVERQYPADFQSVKVVYVDNCCSVHHVLRRIFPSVSIKLDAFHWLKRWNDIMAEPTSAQAGVFRALMSKAIFNVEGSEFEDARIRARRKKKRDPNNKEILKEANAIIPQPEILQGNVEAVLLYIHAKDAETDRRLLARREDDDTPAPKRFFKSHVPTVRDCIRKQLLHVTKGCLSDPPTDLVNIFRYNPKKDVVYVARGTNTNERDNLDLASLLSATHIGKKLLYSMVFKQFALVNPFN
jgi:hypothetical protein